MAALLLTVTSKYLDWDWIVWPSRNVNNNKIYTVTTTITIIPSLPGTTTTTTAATTKASGRTAKITASMKRHRTPAESIDKFKSGHENVTIITTPVVVDHHRETITTTVTTKKKTTRVDVDESDETETMTVMMKIGHKVAVDDEKETERIRAVEEDGVVTIMMTMIMMMLEVEVRGDVPETMMMMIIGADEMMTTMKNEDDATVVGIDPRVIMTRMIDIRTSDTIHVVGMMRDEDMSVNDTTTTTTTTKTELPAETTNNNADKCHPLRKLVERRNE